MAIIGQALPPSDDIIERVAAIVNCEPAVIDAIVKVETTGMAFDPSRRLIARPEAHKVLKCPHLDAKERAKAVKLGLTKQPKLIGYHIDAVGAGNSAWAWIDKLSREFGEDAAFWCASFGAPQIMGFNHTLCQFSSPSSMVRAFADSTDAQLLAMGHFLVASGLKDACRQRKWAVIARLYNGKDYAKNDYDTKLSNAYANSDYAKDTKAPWPEDDVLEMGEKGAEVKSLQQRLTELGFHVRADGDFGPETRDAVRAVQFRLGFAVDGKVGPLTKRGLATMAPKDPAQTTVTEVVRESGTAKASLAQVAIGTVTGGVALSTGATQSSPGLPSFGDIDVALKTSEQGISIVNKILAIGLENLIGALAIGGIIFGGIAFYRRLDAARKRKIG